MCPLFSGASCSRAKPKLAFEEVHQDGRVCQECCHLVGQWKDTQCCDELRRGLNLLNALIYVQAR